MACALGAMTLHFALLLPATLLCKQFEIIVFQLSAVPAVLLVVAVVLAVIPVPVAAVAIVVVVELANSTTFQCCV